MVTKWYAWTKEVYDKLREGHDGTTPFPDLTTCEFEGESRALHSIDEFAEIACGWLLDEEYDGRPDGAPKEFVIHTVESEKTRTEAFSVDPYESTCISFNTYSIPLE